MDKNDKQSKSLNTRQLLITFKDYTAPLTRHAYFIFIMVIILGLAVCLFFITRSFEVDKEAYRSKKELEVKQAYAIDESEDVADEVLRSQTAGAGPIKPNYDPDRDNPFLEN